MPLTAIYDTETNGLLKEATVMHSIGIFFSDGRKYSCADQRGYDGRVENIMMPSGKLLKDVKLCSVQEGLRALAEADLRVAHNGQDFDERVIFKLYPWMNFKEGSTLLDTMHLSRLLYPTIGKEGPNSHKVPPKLRMRHSLEAWGHRLNNHKDVDFDPGDWQTWSPPMQEYMLQDIDALETLFKYLMTHGKPTPLSVQIEHDFAAIMRRQEAWGFGFNYPKALELQAYIANRKAVLEGELIETFGSWWEPGKQQRVGKSRAVKLPEFPDIVQARVSPTTGKPLKDYIGPPKCYWEEGAVWTPVEYVEFSPGSREHVRKMLTKKYGWKPKKFTDKGAATVDDEVLRALPYPEAPMLADFYAALKVGGYVDSGKNSWLKCAEEQPDGYHRIFGRVNTIGTYTFRCSHSSPNMGQIPTRSKEYGHKCRELFSRRPGFTLVGFDGSGMQLRLLAHYLTKWDGGAYAGVFERGEDPHSFMRDSIGTDLMGEGDEGRGKGKTLNYALCFGGGDRKLGSIIEPFAKESRQKELGYIVKERMLPVFGTAFDDLKGALATAVMDKGYIVGLDGRIARAQLPHAALALLLQMGEGVVMKLSLAELDRWLQSEGLTPGVSRSGAVRVADADYEFCANVHDEAQADVRPAALEVYTKYALQCVTHAGLLLKVKCPLKSDVKAGENWASTH